MKPERILSSILLPCSLAIAQEASQSEKGRLSIDRLYSGEFGSERFGPARWLRDGGYTTVEPSKEPRGGFDIVRYDPATSGREVLIAAQQLVPRGGARPLAIHDYTWSEDGRKLLLFTNSRRVWRRNTRGDYWVLDRSRGSLVQIGAGLEPSRLMFAKFSPRADAVAYVYFNDLYIERLNADASAPVRKRLTHNGSDTLINGTFDWVYEEEFSLRDGFRFSPDGSQIAYWQLDSSAVKPFHLIDNTSELYPRLIPIPYPKVGTENSECRIGVIPANGGDTRWIDFPGTSQERYLARMEWAENSTELRVQWINRLQNQNRVYFANTKTGTLREVYVDRDEAWLDVVDDWQWLADGKRFCWLSERDGWRHLYVIDRDTGEARCVTKGEYDVISIDLIDPALGVVYFTASPNDPTQRFLYRIELEGESQAVRVTPEGLGGTNQYQISPDGKWAFHTHSAFASPPRMNLVKLTDHSIVRPLFKNEALRARHDAITRGPAEFFRVDIGDGVELDGWSIKPPGFNPELQYPVIFFVYGEPAAQTVLDRWGGGNYLWHLMLAQHGYVVISLDNRGTPAPRGRAWRKSIYRQIGILASHDQAAALRALKKRHAWIDGSRIGVWGWSGGGSMTLNLLFRYPKLYHTGIAIAFISNQRFYDTIYQERYMGLPDQNREGFKQGSPITHAAGLEGNLLVIHGTADDNCHYQSAEALINRLIELGKQFSMMAYPGRSHSIHEGRGTRKHLYTMMTHFFLNHVEPGTRLRD